MNGVQYELDDEGGIDPTDPLGDLIISDEHGGTLVFSETFIDVWLLSFLRALFSIDSGESLKVEVLEEQYFVLMTEVSGFLNLECEGRSIRLKLGPAKRYFTDATKKLIGELSEYDDVDKNATIAELKKLVE